MQDIQNTPPQVDMHIDRVGVKDMLLPLVVRDRARGVQHTVARVDLGADLPSHFKGTHMSRFVEALESWSEGLDYTGVKSLLADVKSRLNARKAYVVFQFPFFLNQSAPVSGSSGVMSYQCRLTGEMEEDQLSFLLEVDVPVLTVCPCSLAISDEGAHSQRAMVRITVRMQGFIWLEDLIDIAERAGSSPVYTLLKREDEKHVTESAFARPCFVEDVVRHAAQELETHSRVAWFRVEVESFESIHNHNAFAAIERTVRRG